LAEHVRYSGAVLHYSFKEAGKPRGGWLIDLGAEGVDSITWLDLPIPRPLKELLGGFAELLTEPQWAPFTEHYVSAVYTHRSKQLEPLQKLRARYPHCAEVVHEPAERAASAGSSYAERVKGKSDAEVIDAFLAEVRNGEGPSAIEAETVAQVLAEA